MSVRDIKKKQEKSLEEICVQNNVEYNSIILLLESVKIKKLYKRNNSHQQKISNEIEKAVK